MGRVPTADERVMHRARISANDMGQAVAFIDAALAAETRGADSRSDVTHLALVVAAVIYYARPFGLTKAVGIGRDGRRRRGSPQFRG